MQCENRRYGLACTNRAMYHIYDTECERGLYVCVTCRVLIEEYLGCDIIIEALEPSY